MAASETALALIGAGGVVLGALVGGLSGWGTAIITGRRARKDAQETLRREAYSAFVLALDRIDRFRATRPDLNDAETIKSIETLTNEVIEEIHIALTAVILTGSEQALDSAREARVSVWAIRTLLQEPSETGRAGQLKSALDDFVKAGRDFVEIVREELNSP